MGGLRYIDCLLLALYTGLILILGLRGFRRGDTLRQFLVGHHAGWFTVGLSLLVSLASSLGFIAVPSAAHQSGALMLWSLVALPLVYPVVTRVFIPHYRRQGVLTAYEYLEQRFDLRLRLFASGLFIAWRLAWMSAVLYVPAMALNILTRGAVPVPCTVVLAGALATAYTMLGGMRGVLLADAAQAVVMFGGVIITLVAVSAAAPGGAAGLWHAAQDAGKLAFAAPMPDWDQAGWLERLRLYLYTDFSAPAIIIGFTVGKLGNYGVDQLMIQRYLSAKSDDAARKGFLFNCIAFAVFFVLMTATGIAIAVFGSTAGFPPGLKPDTIFPYYIGHYAPAGFAGLMLAGLLAAAISSFDSGVHACASALSHDFFCRLRRDRGSELPAHVGRLSVLALGLTAMVIGCFIGYLGDLFEIALRVLNSFLAPLLAMFLLGLFTRRTHAVPVFWGTLLGSLGTVMLVAARPLSRAVPALAPLNIGFLWVAPAGLLISLAACLACTVVYAFFVRTDSAASAGGVQVKRGTG